MGGSLPASNRIIVMPAWEEIRELAPKGLVMIVGGSDSGKSTFARWLALQLAAASKVPMAFLDGDPGQSILGPPTTVTLSVVPAGMTGLRGGQQWRRFVGSITPRNHMLPLLTGVARLMETARARGIETIVFDTTGLIDPDQGGMALKWAKVDLLRPELLLAIQRRGELDPLLEPLRRSSRTRIVELAPAAQVRRRSSLARRLYRVRRFASHFAGAGRLSVDLEGFALVPDIRPVRNQLLAFEDAGGFLMALGIVSECAEGRSRTKIITRIRSLSRVDTIRFGDIAVDPSSFHDRLLPGLSVSGSPCMRRRLGGT